MLDLVVRETERIESRFLEPACGNGNFLVEILRRKLGVVEQRYRSNQYEWERNAVTAVSAIYGIDILEDNCQECRQRLFEVFDGFYSKRYGKKAKEACRASVGYLLKTNIVWGDALDLCTVGEPRRPIVFAEWSPVNGSLFQRRDFEFRELLAEGPKESDFGVSQESLFGDVQPALFEKQPSRMVSDTGQTVFIPRPVREYPLVHFLEIGRE